LPSGTSSQVPLAERDLLPKHRRAGVTLIEVLVSIFVVALGLLALLTLFPLGALSMAQAIKDDRVAQTAANAVATIKVMNVLSDQTITNALSFNPPPPNNIPVSGPGFAVYFDPIGYKNYPAPYGQANGSVAGGGGVPRLSTVWLQSAGVNTNPLIAAWFTSLDDMTFTKDDPAGQYGLPADDFGKAAVGLAQPQREGRYSWGAILRRPHVTESLTEVYIVVYSGRSTNLNASLSPAGETPLSVSKLGPTPGVPPYTIVTVNPPPSGTVDVRAGAWILDATPASGHGDFYRVTNVTVNGDGTVDLELQTPIKTTPVTQTPITQVVLMDNVAEVVYKGIIAP
jgi:hypothetical protein